MCRSCHSFFITKDQDDYFCSKDCKDYWEEKILLENKIQMETMCLCCHNWFIAGIPGQSYCPECNTDILINGGVPDGF